MVWSEGIEGGHYACKGEATYVAIEGGVDELPDEEEVHACTHGRANPQHLVVIQFSYSGGWDIIVTVDDSTIYLPCK